MTHDNIHHLPPRPEGAARPRISESEADALQLDSFVMHISTNFCLNCSCGERWGTLYEVWTHPTKTGHSALHVLKPTRTLQQLPISYINLPKNDVPCCSECIETFDVGNLLPPIPAASRAAWADTLRRKYTSEPASSPSSTKKPEPTLDML